MKGTDVYVKEHSRGNMVGLKCPELKCRTSIHAMTGLTEIQKLMAHYARKHNYHLSMSAALELRVAIEDGLAEPLVKKD